ncbi:MAG TPA: energy transducer TonB [Usitatibacter sp.]|nr:energy transducer TonB [Usitatibacter sp.]
MKPSTPERAPTEKRPNPGRIRAVVLAVAVHALFIAVIVFGVTWQSAPTAPVQAELWDKLPPAKTSARPPAPKPAPEPAKPEPPKPEPPKPAPEPPKPQPPKPEPPKPQAKPQPAKPDPEIALKAEREKREKEKREKAEQEKREKAEQDKRDKAEREKAEKKRQDQERRQREREEADQMKREQEQRQRQQQLAQAEAERARAAAAAAKQKEFNEWVDKIRARIRGRANVPDSVTGQPEAQFLIRILPGGEVLDITLRKSSGNPAYDNAIERAIRSASPLPVPPPNSELFPRFRELNLVIKHER